MVVVVSILDCHFEFFSRLSMFLVNCSLKSNLVRYMLIQLTGTKQNLITVAAVALHLKRDVSDFQLFPMSNTLQRI